MCLDSGAFFLVQGEKQRTLEHVASILPGHKGVKLIDTFGNTENVTGTIEEIDLLNRRIVMVA
ncbi:MAG: CooT family nickel-binding protein [Geoalkalibacter sp.]|uniref:CooT family nickel-binding protein n=1 Tax=Geoalkalibacter sp. TaxID=3041440 RepID=UPI002A99382B|nr:CooT family nickel-binding protein [Thermodesulfobacteriota bacterium]